MKSKDTLNELLSTKVAARVVSQQANNAGQLMKLFGFDKASGPDRSVIREFVPPVCGGTIKQSELNNLTVCHADYGSDTAIYYTDGSYLTIEVETSGYDEYESETTTAVQYHKDGKFFHVKVDTKLPKTNA